MPDKVQITLQHDVDAGAFRESLRNDFAGGFGFERISIQLAPKHGHVRLDNQTIRLATLQASADIGILVDDDDRLSKRYIETALQRIQDMNADIITAELSPFLDGQGSIYSSNISNRMKMGEKVTLEHMMVGNRVGLGHTVVRTKSLDGYFAEVARDMSALEQAREQQYFKAPAHKTQVLDWALFTRMVQGGRKIAYAGDDKLHIEYRQNANSVTGGFSPRDKNSLRKHIDRKAGHFYAMAHAEIMSESQKEQYLGLANTFKELGKRSDANSAFLTAYTEMCITRAEKQGYANNPFWWEIAHAFKPSEIQL